MLRSSLQFQVTLSRATLSRATLSQITISLWQPVYLRVWYRAVDAARAGGLALVQVWRAHTLRQRRRHEWSALSGLSEHTLKDIGAPDWVVLDAAARSDMAQRRIDRLATWRAY